MGELNGLTEIDPADVSDDDFFLIFDNSAPTTKSKKATRSNVLKGVAREGGDHNFGTSEIADLTATDATIVNLTVTTGLTFDTAATLQKMFYVAFSLVTAGTSPGNGETVTAALTGVQVGDHVTISFDAMLDDGLIVQAWVSAANTVSVRFYDADAGAIAGNTYAGSLAVMRFA